jgi:hypothetical protein
MSRKRQCYTDTAGSVHSIDANTEAVMRGLAHGRHDSDSEIPDAESDACDDNDCDAGDPQAAGEEDPCFCGLGDEDCKCDETTFDVDDDDIPGLKKIYAYWRQFITYNHREDVIEVEQLDALFATHGRIVAALEREAAYRREVAKVACESIKLDVDVKVA